MIYKKHHESPYIGPIHVHWEHWAMACDAAGCDKEIETAEYEDLFDKARLAGWLLLDCQGFQGNYCMAHRAGRVCPPEDATQFATEDAHDPE